MTEYWDAQADTLENAKRAAYSEDDYEEATEAHVRLICDLLGDTKGGTLLDFGCGVGRLTAPMSRALGGEIVGYDRSTEMIRHARDQRAALGLLGAIWYFEEELGFIGMVDGAYSMLVFQHLDPTQLADAISDISHVLFPGAPFVFQYVEGDYHVDFDHRYSEYEIHCLLSGSGMRIVETFPDPQRPEWRWVKAVQE